MDDTFRSSGTLVTSPSGGVTVSITVLPERVRKGADTQLPSSPQPSCFARLHKSAKPRNRSRRAKGTKMLRLVGYWSQPLLGALNYVLSPVKPAYKPVVLPKGFPAMPPTPQAELQAILESLDNKKQAWAALTAEERAHLLRETLKTTIAVSKEGAEAAEAAKGSYGFGIGEEWLCWLPVTWGLRDLADALDAGGAPAPNAFTQRPDGQWVVDTFPLGIESLFFGGMRGEVWIEPGKPPSQGALYRRKAAGTHGKGAVALVLGAGNQTPVSALDVLHKLVLDDSVVICKMNPVNEWLGPYLRRAFAPLVEAGFFEVVYGGAEVGTFLTHHPTIESIHLTGSAATFDAVVWGKQPKVGAPPLAKRVDAELGCVTPYIVVPGAWTEADMEYYADEIVAGLVNNAGHNCTKAELLVTAAEWPLRDALVAAVRQRLAREPRRVAWYPGSTQKAAAFRSSLPGIEELGAAAPADAGAPPQAYLPWLFKAGLSPEEARTQTENWCGVLQEVALPGTGADPARFMEAAVKFANERCWGSLSCSMMVSPDVMEEHASAVDAAVAALRYGSVNINVASMLGFCVPRLTWGAFPGNPVTDIGSGNCAVHNTWMLDHPQKSVLWGPWRYYPAHLWSPSNRNLEGSVPGVIDFMAYPSALTLVAPAVAALRG